MNLTELGAVWSPRLLGLLRIVTAILFMEHGAQKLIGFPPTDHASPEFLSLLWFAGVLELIGGFFVLIGLFTRPVAFLLSGQMAFGYWMVHAPQAIYPALNGGDAAILFCFIFLYLAAAGPGAFSVDGAASRSG
jgi:putative oxidoreductase